MAFGDLAARIHADYKDCLVKAGKIDFEDMINEAVAALEEDGNLCSGVYDHILVDEYQDISAQRHRLIKSLLEQNPNCRLFCVGGRLAKHYGVLWFKPRFFR